MFSHNFMCNSNTLRQSCFWLHLAVSHLMPITMSGIVETTHMAIYACRDGPSLSIIYKVQHASVCVAVLRHLWSFSQYKVTFPCNTNVARYAEQVQFNTTFLWKHHICICASGPRRWSHLPMATHVHDPGFRINERNQRKVRNYFVINFTKDVVAEL